MQKPFFIGIDSDGTAFDSMTIKHRKAFIPAMIETWHLAAHTEKVFEICERINLYSATRGIDRFAGLELTFDEFRKLGFDIPDYTPLTDFLPGTKHSNAGLEAYLEKHDHPFLREVLAWSRAADAIFQREVKKLPPFRKVARTLDKAFGRADIAVISSASEASLLADWRKENLIDRVSRVFGQEFGDKKAQLAAAVNGHYEPRRAMMLGDAPGDLLAARSVNAWFYPIVPGREEESWDDLYRIYLDNFLNDGFTTAVQNELLEKFNAATGGK